MAGLVDSTCRGCVYRAGINASSMICNYYLDTGKRRPCPAGKGCTVKKWTYILTDYPGYEEKDCIRMNLLVYKGKVIGGDICSVELDGFMTGLQKNK